MKKYKFFAHFNRINMQRGLPKVWTIHFRGQCIQAESITFKVPVKTHFRPKARQPRAILIGKAKSINIGTKVVEVS
jgi:hypothetical protein